MASSLNGRAALLEEYGRFYGDEHLAVTFTAGIAGDNAKRVITKGWDKTTPLADGDYGAAYIAGRGATKNPVVVLRPSNLVVLECDSEEDLVRIQTLELPSTITVRSSAEYKRHFWFRPPHELEALPYVAFRFESGRLTADSGRYFLVPPSIHPNGQQYSFLPDRGPSESDIAELPERIYRELSEHARASDDDLREALEIDPEMKIKAGKRRETIFRYACMLRRWGLAETEILEACQRFNLARNHPPVDYYHVQVQVEGAMRKRGDQELATAFADQDTAFSLDVVSAAALCDEPDVDVGQLLGPLVLSGGRTIVVAHTGHGKTTLCMQMVRTILDGGDFLGYSGTGSGRALIIDLEQGRRSVKRSLRDAGLDGRQDVDLVLVPDGLSLDSDAAHLNELDRVLAEGGYTVVVLDPYYKAHRADEPNAERPIVDLMRMLDGLRADYGFALILPAHPRKPMVGSDPIPRLTLHDIAGSGAVSRGAEVILGVERVRDGASRIRFLKDREGELEIDEAWNLVYSKQDGFVRDPKDMEPPKDYRALVLVALKDGEWHTLRELMKETESGEKALKTTLKELVKDELAEYEEGPKGRRKDAKCWRLTPASEAPMHPNAHEQITAFGGEESTCASNALTPYGVSTSDAQDFLGDEEGAFDPESVDAEDDDGIPF